MRLSMGEEYDELIANQTKLSDICIEKIESEYQQEISRKVSERNKIQVEVENLNKDLEKFPKGFYGIDEPTRRFLLFGGEVSEKFLIKSIKLLNAKLSGHGLSKDILSNTPERLTDHFMIWWDRNISRIKEISGTRETTFVNSGERLSSPYLFFDPAFTRISLCFPSELTLVPDPIILLFAQVL